MDISITSICARSGGEEIEITFELCSDGGEHSNRQSFIISSKQYLVLGVAKGVSSEEQYDSVAHQADVWSCVKKGMFLLGYGTCSEKALRMKLVSKGFDKYIAGEAVEHIVSMGLLCANDDAAREAEKMAKKLWGKRRITAGLYEKGYSAEAVSYAISALDDLGINFPRNCHELIEKKYGFPIEREMQNKVFACMMRYGYSAADIREAMK
ncbi:MAG: RecX family transcriptional regulator [Clostridia bacterium]|nr:RecX family transcriptional regulator [Clostridia bacterium]